MPLKNSNTSLGTYSGQHLSIFVNIVEIYLMRQSLNMGQLQVPASVPPAKHWIVYSLQTFRQLDINTDQ